MYNNFSVDIWNMGPNTKEGGITIPGVLTFVRKIQCDMQPTSTELLIKAYGYDTPVTRRFFIDDYEGVSIGTILVINGEKHEIKKAIPWDNYLDAFSLEVA